MRDRRRKHDDTHVPFGGKGKRARKPVASSNSSRLILAERCTSHAPQKDWDMVSSAIDTDERIARGEHQERCAKCLLWLWPDEQGPNFVSTGQLDTD